MSAAVEEWRVIADFPSYAVSDQGRVKRIAPKSDGTIRRDPTLKLIKTSKGYHQVSLWRDGSQFARGVHRLVCEAFHGPAPTGTHAAHNDGNPLNNTPDNLRWATPLENEHDKRLHGTVVRGEQQPRAKLTEADVRAIRQDKRSFTAIAADYGVTDVNIGCIVKRRTWSHVE